MDGSSTQPIQPIVYRQRRAIYIFHREHYSDIGSENGMIYADYDSFMVRCRFGKDALD